jgi:hypothetical protein
MNLIKAMAFPIVVIGLIAVSLVWMAIQRRAARATLRRIVVDVDRASEWANQVADAASVGHLDGAVRCYAELKKLTTAQFLGPRIGIDFVEAACCLLDFTAMHDLPLAPDVICDLRAFLSRTDIDPMDWIIIRLALQTYRARWKTEKRNALVEPFDEFLAFAE